jgi:hypothetical protein
MAFGTPMSSMLRRNDSAAAVKVSNGKGNVASGTSLPSMSQWWDSIGPTEKGRQQKVAGSENLEILKYNHHVSHYLLEKIHQQNLRAISNK